MKALRNVNNWFNLGLALGLQQPTLQGIKEQYKPKYHKREMLTKWLNQVDGCRPSWEALVKALRLPTVECYPVANEIEEAKA